MTGLTIYDINDFLAFWLVTCRLIPILMQLPILGHLSIPMVVKILLALLISLVIFPEVKGEQLVQNLKYAVLQTQPKATRSIVNKFLMKRKHNTLQRVQDVVSKIRDEIEHQQDGVSDNVFNSTEKVLVNHLYQLRGTIRWAYTTRNPSRIANYVHGLCTLYIEYRKTFTWKEILDDRERVRKYKLVQAILDVIQKCVYLLDLKLD